MGKIQSDQQLFIKGPFQVLGHLDALNNIGLLWPFSGIRGRAYIFEAFTRICNSLFQQNLFSTRLLIKGASGISDWPVEYQPCLLQGVALHYLLQRVIGGRVSTPGSVPSLPLAPTVARKPGITLLQRGPAFLSSSLGLK